MHLKNERGQAIIIVILVLGVIMAVVVMFGARRNENNSDLVDKMEDQQVAQEVLAIAAKRVQKMYAEESGCDPGVLDKRLSRMSNLPASASSLAVGATQYVVANRNTTGNGRYNLCTSGTGTGCRQLAIGMNRGVYVVQVRHIQRDPTVRAAGADCPRDALVALHVVLNNNLIGQWFSLTNTCTYTSCNGPTFASITEYASGTETTSGYKDAWQYTTACGQLPARWYGSITNPTYNYAVTTDDLRWARRYLETGGGITGDTTGIYATIATGNGACAPASSSGQCKNRECIPYFDLDKDGNNTEADLAILENFLRGYLLQLPVFNF